MIRHTSGEAVWRLPDVEPPPGGSKILLLTMGGVCVMGTWMNNAGFVAWAPLPALTPEVKERLRGTKQ